MAKSLLCVQTSLVHSMSPVMYVIIKLLVFYSRALHQHPYIQTVCNLHVLCSGNDPMCCAHRRYLLEQLSDSDHMVEGTPYDVHP